MLYNKIYISLKIRPSLMIYGKIGIKTYIHLEILVSKATDVALLGAL